MAARKDSFAATPLAKANASRQEKEQAQAPVRLASASSATGRGSGVSPEVVVAAAGGMNRDDSKVVQAQHSEQAVDSYSVPREPMGAVHYPHHPSTMQPYGAYVPLHATPITPPAGPGHLPRVHGAQRHAPQAHGAPGHSCPSCNHGSGPYQPLFPQFDEVRSGVDCYAPAPTGMSFREADPQEYLFDGGDRTPFVTVRKDDSLSGLDPEDTVVQYQTVDGETFVETGCRVAIYAPRFASVRKKTTVAQSDIAQRLRTTDRPDGPHTFIDRLPSQDLAQPLKARNQGNIHVVESVRDRKIPAPAEAVIPMNEVSEALQPYANLSLFRTGDMRGTDMAKLAVSTANARAWTNYEELNVLVDGQEAIDVSGSKRAEGLSLYEHKGARIRLCKVASEQMANPGDIVSFTIRVDNIGEQPLSNLVITDSLTPRLEFVPGTDKSSIPANFTTVPNAVGSEVLRWELTEGLKPGEGGVVRFDCRVR